MYVMLSATAECRTADASLRISPIFDADTGPHNKNTQSVPSVMALAVPPPNRSRASSTCVRPALSINTIGRRRSSSLVLPVQHPDPSPFISVDSQQPPPSQPSMVSLWAAKCLEFLHVPKLHPSDYSTPSSPHSVNDLDLVLPLSASSQSTFTDAANEKDASSYRWWPFHPAVSNRFLRSRAYIDVFVRPTHQSYWSCFFSPCLLP